MKTKIFITVLALIFSGMMVFAQNKTKTDLRQKSTTNTMMQKDSVYYTCPMDTDVRMDKPGKCPKCGMDLVKKTVKTGTKVNKSEAVKSYTCTMHPEVTSDKPGKCPKCGMDLVVKK
jgi:hypothetical protein